MQELREQDLILYYYGEASDGDAIRRRLEASPADAERYDALCRMLELVARQPVPEPWDDYDARVWRRLQPQLADRATGSLTGRVKEWLGAWLAPRRLASVASVAALVALAFMAGRFWPAMKPESGLGAPGQTRTVSDRAAAGRERILLVSVGEHLERSEMLLIELVNAPSGSATADLSDELRRAEELLPFNRLYRQAARRSGQAAVAEMLDELERLLLDVAHSDTLTVADLGALRQRIEADGILFRVQVVGARVEREQRNPQQPRLPDTSGDV